MAATNSPSPALRLFVALGLTEAVRADLDALREPLPGLAWVQREALHLTLRFIGEVPGDQRSRIEDALSGIRVASFLLPLEGVGMLPPRPPAKVVYAGVGSGHPHLYQLRQRCDDSLLSLGLDIDVRRFQPHITLARCSAAARGVPDWLHRHRDFAGAPFPVRSFGLFSSQLGPDGARHTLLKDFPLA
jgi:RNA 2',3'-cyclic 3'-phosphodiesterase